MSDANLYHKALTEYRDGKASPELISKAYVLAAGSANSHAQEIEYVKLRVAELKGSAIKDIVDKAATVVKNAASRIGETNEAAKQNQRLREIRAACNSKDATAVGSRAPTLGRAGYAFCMIASGFAFDLLSKVSAIPISTIVFFAGLTSALITSFRLKDTGINGVWAFSALIPFNFVLGIYCLVVRPNYHLSQRKEAIELLKNPATSNKSADEIISSLGNPKTIAEPSSIGVLVALVSTAVFMLTLKIVTENINTTTSIAPTQQPAVLRSVASDPASQKQVRESAKPSLSLPPTNFANDSGQPQFSGKRLTLNLQSSSLITVVNIIAKVGNISLSVDPSVNRRVDVYAVNEPWDDVLYELLLKYNLTIDEHGFVYSPYQIHSRALPDGTVASSNDPQWLDQMSKKVKPETPHCEYKLAMTPEDIALCRRENP